MTNSVNIDGLKDTFNSWSNALNQGDLDKFFGYFDDESETLDEDYPWRMNKADFVDHINFHAMGGGIGMWEFFEWIPREVCFQKRGETAVVSGYATFRGKPKDAGFRQRFMGFTQTWQKIDGDFLLVSFHQGPLQGQIEGASPS